jgi:hypothetical protein
VRRFSRSWIGTYADFVFCVTGFSDLIGVNGLGAFTFFVVIADATGMGLLAFLA